MATYEQIKDAILAAAGNPESGVIADLASDMARAVVAIDQPEEKDLKPMKETRVMAPSEIR